MWTNDRPCRVGWYWFRVADPCVPAWAAKPVMLLIRRERDGTLLAEDLVNHERYRVREIEGLWAGPLDPPEAA